MDNIFITKIQIGKVRHLENIDVELSADERKHLIFTGKNGSGKTSLLEAMRASVDYHQRFESHIASTNTIKCRHNKVCMNFLQPFSASKDMIFVYISARRSKLSSPKAIEPIEVRYKNEVSRNVSADFLKYILNLDYRLYGAKTDENKQLEASLDKWFDNFEKALQNIYDSSELKLKRDTKNLAFRIEMPGRETFALNEMSDGYAAFLNIVMELLMRFEEADAEVDYDKSAIVMIDEIETHMHVELQKKALPFLTQMFPNVQFIVATHSPFVITSLEDAVVFDLEKRERLERPSFYSYDTVVESFLDTSMYSHELQKYFARYKELCLKERTPEENKEFLRAKAELEIKTIPSTELYIAFQELEKARKAAKNGTIK